jgi:hypothetical protein
LPPTVFFISGRTKRSIYNQIKRPIKPRSLACRRHRGKRSVFVAVISAVDRRDHGGPSFLLVRCRLCVADFVRCSATRVHSRQQGTPPVVAVPHSTKKIKKNLVHIHQSCPESARGTRQTRFHQSHLRLPFEPFLRALGLIDVRACSRAHF